MKGNVVETSPGVVWVKHNWLCKRFTEGGIIPQDLFFTMPNAQGYICMPKFKLDEMESKKKAYANRTKALHKTADLNNTGIAYEKSGNIPQAIKTYEECVAIGHDAPHAYDRLMILYRKAKDYNNEIRVIKRALEIFKYQTLAKKYKERLEKATALSKN